MRATVRAGVLDRLLSGAPGDVTSQTIGLEAGGQQRRWAAHHVEQLRLAQRLHFDLVRRAVERLVVLQFAEKVGAHAHHDA
jgi:hypothetical protein